MKIAIFGGSFDPVHAEHVNMARAAAETLGKKYPNNKVLGVDSRAASLGEGLFVHFVNKKAEEGVSIDEAYDYALSIRDDI